MTRGGDDKRGETTRGMTRARGTAAGRGTKTGTRTTRAASKPLPHDLRGGGGDLFYFNLVSISLPPSTIGGLFLYFIHLSLILSVGDLFFCWLSFELRS